MHSIDSGLTHVAFFIRNLEASIRFYQQFANMTVIHRREATGDIQAVAWMSDLSRPFALVLIESDTLRDTPLGPHGHLGVACSSREAVQQLAEQAQRLGILRSPPQDGGYPVGYWAYIADPDGNTLEISYGQKIAFTIQGSASGLSA
ncbi:VOC family protein [Aquipseudomonas guryensis]|uniref:VOC family protein n=1 Tax=Aquipseudomonas guryensis TaxID=2759165 RepID=A0A7W4DEC0_9GAMM|nr:VOC family protein [Pseudomonas guryensis]MBB1521028.1 VOC family protein [Pseudomonas guryensis]